MKNSHSTNNKQRKIPITIHLRRDTLQIIDDKCQIHGITRSEFITQAINLGIEDSHTLQDDLREGWRIIFHLTPIQRKDQIKNKT